MPLLQYAAGTLHEQGSGLYLFTLNPEGEPAGMGCGLYLEPAGMKYPTLLSSGPFEERKDK